MLQTLPFTQYLWFISHFFPEEKKVAWVQTVNELDSASFPKTEHRCFVWKELGTSANTMCV